MNRKLLKARTEGFTLIELLIVVAIIAILAAIAVPNFLEAQTRSKVSRVKADMRTYATALEAYAVDWNKYPPNTRVGTAMYARYAPLSTPVAYMTNALLKDPFKSAKFSGFENWNMYFKYFSWVDIIEQAERGDPNYAPMLPVAGKARTVGYSLDSPGPTFKQWGGEI
jgi:type II secretion system protein G